MTMVSGVGVVVLLLLSVVAAAVAAGELDYMVVVEGWGGGRCSGSLVAPRAVLTSGGCARLAAAPGPLRALAAAAPCAGCASLVTSIARAAQADLAVLALQTDLSPAHARPVLVANDSAAAAPAACWAARATPQGLRVQELRVAPPQRCAPHSKHFFCIEETELCLTELGAGVLCGGKLCGVLSSTSLIDNAAKGAGQGGPGVKGNSSTGQEAGGVGGDKWGGGTGGEWGSGGAGQEGKGGKGGNGAGWGQGDGAWGQGGGWGGWGTRKGGNGGGGWLGGSALRQTEAAGCGRFHVVQALPPWRDFLRCAVTQRACGKGACASKCSELVTPRAQPAPPGPAPAPAPYDDAPVLAPSRAVTHALAVTLVAMFY